MNLFWQKVLGNILSTSKYENQEKAIVKEMKRYDEISNSAELDEYNRLFKIVKSAEFKDKKKTYQNRKYKDTEYYRIFHKFNKLEHNSAFQSYFSIVKSEILNEYIKFQNSPDFSDLSNKEKINASPLLQKLKSFEKSNEYKIYTRYHESYIEKEYQELKKKVSAPEFQKENAFWSDKQRWKTTPEYTQEQRFYALDKTDIINFYTHTKPEKFAQHRKLIKSFTDNFEWNTLDKSFWKYGFHAGNEQLMKNYSFFNEQQANNNGKNIRLEGGVLDIQTRHEKITATAWDTQKGFVPKEFDYTSDIIQTAEGFKQKYGLFRAKIRCTGNIHHAFWLGAEGKLPHINIFHFNGKEITMGNAHLNVMDEVKIKGLAHTQYYIYSLIWTPKELIWFINDLEVYRTSSNVPHEPMYLGFNSFIPQKQKPSTGNLYVDWVRAFALEK